MAFSAESIIAFSDLKCPISGEHCAVSLPGPRVGPVWGLCGPCVGAYVDPGLVLLVKSIALFFPCFKSTTTIIISSLIWPKKFKQLIFLQMLWLFQCNLCRHGDHEHRKRLFFFFLFSTTRLHASTLDPAAAVTALPGCSSEYHTHKQLIFIDYIIIIFKQQTHEKHRTFTNGTRQTDDGFFFFYARNTPSET